MAGYDRSLYQTFLSQVPMFTSCTPEQLDRIAELGDAVAAPDGSAIVKEGDDADAFFVITSGKAVIDRGGREVASIGAGQYFGELALFDPSPRNATVTASGMVSLVRLKRDDFTRALNETPAMRDALLHGMARRLHELDAHA
ncbi:MAG TPA: cyclic nucleotide-binding domain-containing protein [Acidimicrobiia bacterium]|nr:cyclic nucleotide-binding domain-containing protein [Acidimicrobiia bacterium]